MPAANSNGTDGRGKCTFSQQRLSADRSHPLVAGVPAAGSIHVQSLDDGKHGRVTG